MFSENKIFILYFLLLISYIIFKSTVLLFFHTAMEKYQGVIFFFFKVG